MDNDESLVAVGGMSASVTRQVVNLLHELHTEIGKARRILVKMHPQMKYLYVPGRTAIGYNPPEIEQMLQAGAETATAKSFEEFNRAIRAAYRAMIQAKYIWEARVRAHLNETGFYFRGPVYTALDEVVNLTYIMNYDLKELMLAANAAFVHGQWQSTDQLAETEGVTDTLLNLAAMLSAAYPPE